MTGYFRLALIVMLLAGIAGVSAIVTMQFAVHREEVRVPDLQGMPVSAATSRAAALGLDLAVTERFYSTTLPAGGVLLQTPAPGGSVRRGWQLAVAESLGPQKISVPDLRGKSEHDAILLLREKGLELGAVAHLPDNRVSPGTVLAQDPGADARGADRRSVSLLLAEAETLEIPAFVMPEEVGRSVEDAQAQLAKAGLHAVVAEGAPPGAQVLIPTNTASPDTRSGAIVAQEPQDGARVDARTRIVLWTPAASIGLQPKSQGAR